MFGEKNGLLYEKFWFFCICLGHHFLSFCVLLHISSKEDPLSCRKMLNLLQLFYFSSSASHAWVLQKQIIIWDLEHKEFWPAN